MSETPGGHVPQYRPPSTKHAPTFSSAVQRQQSAGAFSSGASVYEDCRPGYPAEVISLVDSAERILDVGAGTGKLTADLLGCGQVFALDPSADMVRVLAQQLPVPVWRATAEATALADATIDVITCAQTWHWVEVEAACAEFDRILRPGGHVVLVWNTLDVSDPWVLRLARIMHSGDIMPAGFSPQVAQPFEIIHRMSTSFVDSLTTEEIHTLTHTRSYWLRSNETIRQRVTNNLNWYLQEHTGLAPGDLVKLPYRTDAFVLRRRTEKH